MSPPKKHKNIITSPVIRSADGVIKDKYNPLKPKEDIADIKLTTKTKIKKTPQEKNLFMLEFPLRNSNLISKDKFNFLKTNSRNIKLLPTLLPDLISNEKDLIPFWNKSCKDLSKKLLPTLKTDSLASDLNLSKKSVNNSIPNSSFKIIAQNKKLTKKNSQMTSYQSLQFLPQDTMEKENTLLKIARTIKFKPSTKLRKYLNKAFGIYRLYYNKAVKYINDLKKNRDNDIKMRKHIGTCCHTSKYNFSCDEAIENNLYCKKHKNSKSAYKINYNLDILRNNLIEKKNEIPADKEWLRDIPYDLKQEAIRELLGNIKSGISNFINNGRKFNIGYKSKKNINKYLKLPNHFINLKNQYMFTTFSDGKDKTFSLDSRTKRFLEKIDYLTNTTLGIGKKGIKNYYIYVTYDTTVKELDKPFKSVAIDPGVRNFCSFYSPGGVEGFLGKDFDKDILKIGKKIDNIISLKNKKIPKTENQGEEKYERSYRTRRHLNFRYIKLREKLKNKVSDLHKKIMNFLCINFETIIIPKFDVSKKIKIGKRKISNEVVRRMLSLRHGEFLEKLKSYCKRIKTNLVIVSEEYTSKTCGSCGNIKEDLEDAKTYNCKKCNYKGDRDLNGARNILIKTAIALRKRK